MNKLAMATVVALAASSVWAMPGTIKTSTDQRRGDITWQRRTKSYVLTYKKGQTDVQAQYPLDSVERLDIEKPANFDKLVELVARGQGGAAIGGLTKIVQDYRMLVWDKPAGRYLVEAYLAANNPQKAYETAQSIIAEDKDAAWKGDLAPAYWQSLLKLNKTAQLENCLRKAISSGDRACAAEATVMRGDIILTTAGDTPDAHRQALAEAYLRVALMYPDEPCRNARVAAMQKAALSFDKLGMAARAEGMRTQAKTL
ncbi:MAG: hypothetical protein ACI4R9_07655 [Kiritimatiellia bacterium]